MRPAARQFQAWLDAVNAHSHSKFFHEKCSLLPKESNDRNLRLLNYLRVEMGGLDFVSAEVDEETRFVGVVRDKAYGNFRRVVLRVESREPWLVNEFDFRLIPTRPEHRVQRMSEPEALAAFDERLKEWTAADRFSGAVLVARNGKTIFSAAYGFQDRERDVRNTLDTRFRMASTGKLFTATAAVQLAQKGLLDLHEPIGRYLPDYPHEEAASKVTAHHLLTQTSGLSSDPRLFWAKFDQLHTLEDHMLAFGPLGLDFEPGSGWAYSNYGFLLLGLLIERVAKQDYYDYVHQHVFAPAEMDSAGFAEDYEAGRIAVGYVRRPDGQLIAETRQHKANPGGGALATVEDFKRYADALLEDRLLDVEHTRRFMEAKVEHSGDDVIWGPGMRIAYEGGEQVVDGVRWLSRTGCTTSGNSEFRIYPDSGYVVAALTNIPSPAAMGMVAFIGDRLPAQ